MHGDLPIPHKGVNRLRALFTVFILVVINSAAIRGFDDLESQEYIQVSREKPNRRRLLRDSSCTLYRKCVTYEDSSQHYHHNHSWACQLSPEDSEYLDADFLDIVHPSSTLSASLANATSGQSTLRINGAIADTDRMEMYVQDDSSVEEFGRNIILDRSRVPPSNTGTHKLLVIRITDGNNLSPDATADQLYKNIFDDAVSLKTQMKACSYGKLQIEPFTGATPTQQIIDNGIVNINVTGVVSTEDTFVQAAKSAAKEKLGDLSDPRFGLVMFCLPQGKRGIAWAYANNKFSFYSNKWCGAVASTMHEVGHNIGLAHSGEIFQGENGDGIGFMGSNPGRKDVRMCYNPQKNYQLGWYEDKTESINPLDGKGRRMFKLNGIADYQKKNNAIVVLRLEQVSKIEDYYIGFNHAKGINKDTLEDKGKLVIIRKDKGGPQEYGQSTKIASLIPGERHVIRNFDNAGNVQIIFKGLKNGNAKIIVINDKKMRRAKKEGKCKKFTIDLLTDNRPKDTAWYITDKFGKAVAFSKPYRTRKQRVIEEVCLPMHKKAHKYKFTILDDKGNGMCCQRGKGSYKIIDEEGNTIISGGRFSKSKSHFIRVPRDKSLSGPTDSPSMAPSMNLMAMCVDNPMFAFNEKAGKNCDWVAADQTSNRCQKDGVLENCRATCDPRCGALSQTPSFEPSISGSPSRIPSTAVWSDAPSENPSIKDANDLSNSPSMYPSIAPVEVGSINPSQSPSSYSSNTPSVTIQSAIPTIYESQNPSSGPFGSLSITPSAILKSPSTNYSDNPSESPFSSLSNAPSTRIRSDKTSSPSISPSKSRFTGMSSDAPSWESTENPSSRTSNPPSSMLSIGVPPEVPLPIISNSPSKSPSKFPSKMPSDLPSLIHSDNPSISTTPSEIPLSNHTDNPSFISSQFPSITPSSGLSSAAPLSINTGNPSFAPSMPPSIVASIALSSEFPSSLNSDTPSFGPSSTPSTLKSSGVPSETPSLKHSDNPSQIPSVSPSITTWSSVPSQNPSSNDSSYVSDEPSRVPSSQQSDEISEKPSGSTSHAPSTTFSSSPSAIPSGKSVEFPTTAPSLSSKPSDGPSDGPTGHSSLEPSAEPTFVGIQTVPPSVTKPPKQLATTPTPSSNPSGVPLPLNMPPGALSRPPVNVSEVGLSNRSGKQNEKASYQNTILQQRRRPTN